MATNKKKSTSKRKKSQQRAVIILIIMTVTLLVVAFLAAQNMYLNETTDDRRAQLTGNGGDYQNLQGEISRFFGGVREAAWGRSSEQNRVIALDQDLPPISAQIEDLAFETDSPLNTDFRGEIKTRWFMSEDTLKGNSDRFAAEENVNLLWRIPNDYKVSSAFQVHSDLINTMDRLARSLNSEHPDNIQAFWCPRSRAILITGSDEAQAVSQYCYTMDQLQRIEIETNADSEREALERRGLN